MPYLALSNDKSYQRGDFTEGVEEGFLEFRARRTKRGH
jgi:hypothetical protein